MIETKTDAWMKKHVCAFVSVLEEYKGHRRPGLLVMHIMHIIHIYHFLHILYILYILHIILFTGWVDACQSTIVYERRESAQILYVVPVSSRLAILEPSPSRCEGNRLTFRAQVVIRHRAAVTDVGGGM
jgi:hypothetical protein